MENHHSQKIRKLRKLWKVINFAGETLFAGQYDESYRYILKNVLTNVILRPPEVVSR
jgi:hypothetical protein